MPIRTTCPSCRTVYSLADHLAGKTVRCKNCQEAIVVRAANPSAETASSGGSSGAREKIQARPQLKRPPVAEAEEPPRSRRNRDDEDDSPPIRRGNRGLLIGLIVGGGGLVLLLGGGVLVVVLLLAGSSGNKRPGAVFNSPAPQPGVPVPPMGQPAAQEPPQAPPAGPISVTLQISGVANQATREAITDKLEEIIQADQGGLVHNTFNRGDRMTVVVMPVKDVQAFSQKLDFGTVNKIDGNTITMTARKVDGLPDNADAVTKALHNLKSTNPRRRADAIRKLTETLPDDKHRAEVVKALEPLIHEGDIFTRQNIVKAIGAWGNKDAVPILLDAMRDKDTRRAAMKALGRIKDERAAEPLAERLEDFFDRHDAAEALKQMGPVAEKAVLARLNHHDWQVRQPVCEILQVIGTKQSIPALEKVAADNNQQTRILVAPKAREALQAIKARQ